jgi:DNA-binding transcriptional regulator YdaS (Cro superfamily)
MMKSLKGFLKSKRIPQTELANHIGVLPANLSHWINWGNLPRKHAPAIAQYLKIEESQVLEMVAVRPPYYGGQDDR